MKVLHIFSRRGWSCLLCGIVALVLAAVMIPDRVSANAWARNTVEQIAFLEQFGWTVRSAPVETKTVQIPWEFGEVYTRYNQIQLEQGFDLRPYAGKKVEMVQYQVTNYPNFSETIRANLLIYQGKIIGGDISSVELGGFMQGFSMISYENEQ